MIFGKNRGFTLVELMIVIAIIGILAAALFPALSEYLARGRDTARKAHLKDIRTALLAYHTDNSEGSCLEDFNKIKIF